MKIKEKPKITDKEKEEDIEIICDTEPLTKEEKEIIKEAEKEYKEGKWVEWHPGKYGS